MRVFVVQNLFIVTFYILYFSSTILSVILKMVTVNLAGWNRYAAYQRQNDGAVIQGGQKRETILIADTN